MQVPHTDNIRTNPVLRGSDQLPLGRTSRVCKSAAPAPGSTSCRLPGFSVDGPSSFSVDGPSSFSVDGPSSFSVDGPSSFSLDGLGFFSLDGPGSSLRLRLRLRLRSCPRHLRVSARSRIARQCYRCRCRAWTRPPTQPRTQRRRGRGGSGASGNGRLHAAPLTVEKAAAQPRGYILFN
eukprot:scaffold97459_cov60-Phaeocystis_antarctica.AAC.1